MRRLVCAFVVRNPPKTGFLASRPIFYSSDILMDDDPFNLSADLQIRGHNGKIIFLFLIKKHMLCVYKRAYVGTQTNCFIKTVLLKTHHMRKLMDKKIINFLH